MLQWSGFERKPVMISLSNVQAFLKVGDARHAVSQNKVNNLAPC